MSHPPSTSASDNSSGHRRQTATGMIFSFTGYYAVLGGSVQLDGNQLRNAGLFHRHAIQAIGNLHGLAIVGDDDELGVALHAAQHLDESADVRVIERGVDFVEQTEGARFVL